MKGVYILAGVLIVILGAVFVSMIMTKIGIKMFKSSNEKEIGK